MIGTALQIHGLNKSFGAIHAIRDLNLSVQEGQILALVGPSGCGKTTLLRLIAGFERPDSGIIKLRDQIAADAQRILPPERRGVGMVFQDYALFPHLTVEENIGFGLESKPEEQRDAVVREMLSLVGLLGYRDRHPSELSGGERQRVALARALAPHPIILLLDEPFSNLDADRRIQMREEVRSILKGVGATTILVTHDQEEALYFGDELAVLQEGKIQQIGTPEGIFHTPVSQQVADFMGQTKFLPGEVTEGGILTEVGLLNQQVDAPVGAHVDLAVRADDVDIEPREHGPAFILERQFMGAQNLYRIRLPSGRTLHSLQPHTRVLPPGTQVVVHLQPGHALACFRNGKAIPPQGDQPEA